MTSIRSRRSGLRLVPSRLSSDIASRPMPRWPLRTLATDRPRARRPIVKTCWSFDSRSSGRRDLAPSATCTHVSHHTRQRHPAPTLIISHHRSRAPRSHILIVYTTYTAVNDTIAVDPSRIPASARAHRGSGARLHRSPPHKHTAADRVGHPSTPTELVAVAGTPERQARTPRTGVPPAHRRAPQLPLVGRPIHAYDVIHSATA